VECQLDTLDDLGTLAFLYNFLEKNNNKTSLNLRFSADEDNRQKEQHAGRLSCMVVCLRYSSTGGYV
jgi:hypothetical protein